MVNSCNYTLFFLFINFFRATKNTQGNATVGVTLRVLGGGVLFLALGYFTQKLPSSSL